MAFGCRRRIFLVVLDVSRSLVALCKLGTLRKKIGLGKKFFFCLFALVVFDCAAVVSLSAPHTPVDTVPGFLNTLAGFVRSSS